MRGILELAKPRRLDGADEASAVPFTGMRRVGWVRVVVGDGPPSCHVVGVSHRLPSHRPVPLGTAVALARDGVPMVVRRHPKPHPQDR